MRKDGWPQATTVAYANYDLTHYVATGADSQKVNNIRRFNKVSLTISNGSVDWGALQGLSAAALAKVIESPANRQMAARPLKKKFPTLAGFGDPEHESGQALLRIKPKIVSLIDYTKGNGHTLLIPLPTVGDGNPRPSTSAPALGCGAPSLLCRPQCHVSLTGLSRCD